MKEKAMTFPRRDRGPTRRVNDPQGFWSFEAGKVKWNPDHPYNAASTIFTGVRKALRG